MQGRNLCSYIVAYDSGFAPNPFGGFCTLATCKGKIRELASVNDWIIGTDSNRKGIRRRGYLVYAMRVTEILSITKYWNDPRFDQKKPNLSSSYRMACGDNIYFPPADGTGGWRQLNSYHSNSNGSPNKKHIVRDTLADRVLISEDFVYFGAEGPALPAKFEQDMVCANRGSKRVRNNAVISAFEKWLRELEVVGYQGKPREFLKDSKKRK
ncbi:MAG: hypothetical protein HRT36_07140 [Alphaproteobacteria bacterium]|nr:hypothetical protein [Alphaproteobacteria bacterium]